MKLERTKKKIIKVIAGLLTKFIKRYRLYILLGHGEKRIIEVRNINTILPKDGKYHSVVIRYLIKSKKKDMGGWFRS